MDPGSNIYPTSNQKKTLYSQIVRFYLTSSPNFFFFVYQPQSTQTHHILHVYQLLSVPEVIINIHFLLFPPQKSYKIPHSFFFVFASSKNQSLLFGDRHHVVNRIEIKNRSPNRKARPAGSPIRTSKKIPHRSKTCVTGQLGLAGDHPPCTGAGSVIVR